MNIYLKAFVSFLLGIGIGLILFFSFNFVPLPPNNPILSSLGIHRPRIIGFLPYFLLYRATNNYNPYINTLSYFSLSIDSDGHIQKLISSTQEEPGWHELHTKQVKQKLSDAKNHGIILSLTVAQLDEATIAALLVNPQTSAKNLLSDCIPLMKQYGFVDLNLDVESFKKVDEKTQQQFTIFVHELQSGLQKQHLGTLTVDVAPIAFVNTTIINPIHIGEIADYIFVMGYDLHTVISSNTGPIAPLGGADIESEIDIKKTIGIATQEVNPQKIILGIPLYGYEWDSLSSTPGAATIPNTGQTASNKRITDTFTSSCITCMVKEDNLAKESDYIYQEKVGDDYFHQAFVFDKKALGERITFAKDNYLGGLGLWALGYENNTMLEPLVSYKTTFLIK